MFSFGNTRDDSALHLVRDWLLIITGVFSACFGLKAMLIPHGLVDGGVTGMSLLITAVSGWNPAPLIVLINLPFIAMARLQVNRGFALCSVVAVSLLAFGLLFLQFPSFTKDVWLVTVFGGFFLGAGMGLVIRGGAIIDGTEVVALYLSRRSSLSLSDIHLMISIVLFSFTAILLNLETAMYSILTYFTTSKTTEFLIEGVEEYIGVTIVTTEPERMRDVIIDKLGRGVTLYHGTMGYGKRGQLIRETEILYTVITRLEIHRLKEEVAKLDEQAFVVMNSVKDIRGGIIKKRPLKHS